MARSLWRELEQALAFKLLPTGFAVVDNGLPFDSVLPTVGLADEVPLTFSNILCNIVWVVAKENPHSRGLTARRKIGEFGKAREIEEVAIERPVEVGRKLLKERHHFVMRWFGANFEPGDGLLYPPRAVDILPHMRFVE